MDYNTFIRNLLSLDPGDVQAMTRMTSLLASLSDPTTQTLLANIRAFEKLVTRIESLDKVTITPPSTVTQHLRFINRVERIAECEGKRILPKAAYPPGASAPYFDQMDIVYVDFGGVGWEYDGEHYALVWEDKHSQDQLIVIPATSQYSGDTATEFSIGQINGLPATKSILTVHKTMTIDRRRVIFHRGKYLQGVPPRLQKSEIRKKVKDAQMVWLHGYKTLEDFVKYQTGSMLPDNLITHYPNIRFTPVIESEIRFDHANEELHYQRWDEAVPSVIKLNRPNAMISKDHKVHMIYNKIFSTDPTIKRAGLAEYNRLFS